MRIAIADILSAEEVAEIRKGLASAHFEDGRATAGWAAAEVKSNAQAVPSGDVEALTRLAVRRLEANPAFQLAARPKCIIRSMFTRYGPGDRYGTHVDNAIMDGQRTDVSFTLFLSDPQTYAGGELVIEGASGEEAVKLPSGGVFVYPSTTLHRVEPVSEGERYAFVGWIRSIVREESRRELLFDLGTARQLLHRQSGKTPEFDLLSKCYSNLLRMWCED